MAGEEGWTAKTVVFLGVVVIEALAHLALDDERFAGLSLVLLLLPPVVVGYLVVRAAGNRLLWAAIFAAISVGILLAEHAGSSGLAMAYGVPHAVVYLILLWLFGRTLSGDNVPLITRLAHGVHGTMPAEMIVYTRKLTVVWCVFFAGQVVVSGLLLAFAPTHVWSLFVNVLNFPLLALAFVGEYAYRSIRHRDFPRSSIVRAIHAFRANSPFLKNARSR